MKRLAMLAAILFMFVLLYVIYMPPRQVTLKDLQKSVIDNPASLEPILQETTIIDSPVSESVKKIRLDTVKPDAVKVESGQVEYYIIIESYRNPALAQQKAEKLKKTFSADIFALPPTANGYSRLSYGRYSTQDEAKSVMKKIRTSFGPGVWIYSAKK